MIPSIEACPYCSKPMSYVELNNEFGWMIGLDGYFLCINCRSGKKYFVNNLGIIIA